MKTIRKIILKGKVRMLLWCSLFSATYTASAQNVFVISPKMKEAEIIKKGMTEAGDSVARAQYTRWYEDTNPIWHAADSAGLEEAEAWFNNNCDDSKVTDYGERTREAKQRYEDFLSRYIRSHADEYPAAALIARRLLYDFKYTAADYDEFLALVGNNPDTVHVNFIRRNIDTARKYALGNRYTDFSGKCPDNTSASLSSQMQPGKWTLVDFWASWCGPCRAAIPKVKGLLEQYGDRLQVVSVSVDEKEANWREAEKKESMSWPQLWIEKDETATDAYAVNAIPRLVLIDAEGRISLVTNDVNLVRQKLEAL